MNRETDSFSVVGGADSGAERLGILPAGADGKASESRMSIRQDNIYETGEYARRNPTYHVQDSAWKARQILKMLGKNGLQPQSVCEIGCGAGEILKQLQSNLPPAADFFGYEISPQAFTLCRERENERLHFFREDLLASEAQCFDLLLCIDVFEHVEDYLGFLRNLRRKAIHKIFHIPLDMSAQWVLRGGPILRQRESVGHLHYFMKGTALATLTDSGYVVRDWFYTPSGIGRPLSIKARLASWPRRLAWAIHQDLAVRILGGYSLLVLAE